MTRSQTPKAETWGIVSYRPCGDSRCKEAWRER